MRKYILSIPARQWLKLSALLLAIAAIVAVLFQTGLFRLFLEKDLLSEFLKPLGPYDFLGFIFLQVFQVLVAVLPGEATGILGGYLFGIFWGVVFSTIGLALGSALAFLLSKRFGRPLVDRLLGAETVERFTFALNHEGRYLVFLLFFLPGFPKDYLCYLFGLGHMSLWFFMAASTLGRFFGTILLTYGGSLLRQQRYLEFSLVVGVAILALIAALAYRDKVKAYFKS